MTTITKPSITTNTCFVRTTLGDLFPKPSTNKINNTPAIHAPRVPVAMIPIPTLQRAEQSKHSSFA